MTNYIDRKAPEKQNGLCWIYLDGICHDVSNLCTHAIATTTTPERRLSSLRRRRQNANGNRPTTTTTRTQEARSPYNFDRELLKTVLESNTDSSVNIIPRIQSRGQLRRLTTNSTSFKSFNASSLSSAFGSFGDDDSCQSYPTQKDGGNDDGLVSLCDSEAATAFYNSDDNDSCFSCVEDNGIDDDDDDDDKFDRVVRPTKTSSTTSTTTTTTTKKIRKTSTKGTPRPMIFRGAVETWEAFMNGRFTLTTCIDCGHYMVSVDDAAWVVCANCRMVYPLNAMDAAKTTCPGTGSSATTTTRKEPAQQQFGIGMGFHPNWCMTLLQEERMKGKSI